MAKTDEVHEMAIPLAATVGADVYDVTMAGGKLVVVLTKPGGIDLDTLTVVSRKLGAELDEADTVSGVYTLEVSSPGLERTLRTAGHFAGAIGDEVTIRTKPDVDGDRRLRGVIAAVGPDSVDVDLEADGGRRSIVLEDIERARTVFTWESTPKQGAQKKKPQTQSPQHKKARP